MKKFLHRLFSPTFLAILLILLQLALLVLIFAYLDTYFWTIQLFFELMAIPVAFAIFNSKMNSSYKIAWMFFVIVSPLFGVLFYLLFANKKFTKRELRKIAPIDKSMKESMNSAEADGAIHKIDQTTDGACYNIARYIKRFSNCNIYQDTSTTYFAWGEDAFPVMLEKLRAAKHYIFLEYFIISPGKMWNKILAILKEKAQNGVDVRVIYDDFGCLATLPSNYDKKLEAMGIKCLAFNKIRPLLDIRMNNRDHRKILVIDGYVGFTGGINIADEYINEIVRFGKWKDNCIMLEGDAVFSLTSLFLSTWLLRKKDKETLKFSDYLPSKYIPQQKKNIKANGFVQPYGSLPYTYENASYNVYLNLILKATRYIYISTPYLVLNSTMQEAICLAAKSGVKVKILTPGIPDKKTVFEVTRSFYKPLVESGVEIYEYQPGFVHEKVFLVDDIMGTVGTVNLDYRSLFLHMENGTFLYKTDCLKDIKNDFEQTFLVSKQQTLEVVNKVNPFRKFYRLILKIFSPLL